jgi:hypothetical protein
MRDAAGDVSATDALSEALGEHHGVSLFLLMSIRAVSKQTRLFKRTKGSLFLGKKPLKRVLSAYTNSETAMA